ncbi:fimbrial protein [Serratia liquefaciens]|uniref:fimbrial protein n=1 Tax=Serratia liquefaciens TaxID=614 RepID=UPI002360373F|nr:fimbrial protein [Serratia liquefaciens]
MKIRSVILLSGVVLSSWLLPYQGLAADNMSFRGVLHEYPPCEINDGKPVEINFGDVGVNKVDGKNYAQPFTITYKCEGARVYSSLRHVGAVTAFDKAAVQSNIADFGIHLAIEKNGKTAPFDIGSTMGIEPDRNSSSFIATPVKKAGVRLQEGAFTATAMLQMEYP